MRIDPRYHGHLPVRHRTTIKPNGRPSRLVASGPFRFSRNPMYVGVVAGLLGVALLAGSVPFFAGPVIFWVVMRWKKFVPAEEAALEAALGEEYRGYKQRVRRWL